ncbi:MAG TPA: SpoIIE family protein phosphatase [Cellulomonas sp.]
MSKGVTDVDEDRRIEALQRLGVLDAPHEERFDRVVRLARQLFDVPTALVSLVDRDRVVYLARTGFEQPEVPSQDTFCAQAVQHDEMLVVEDAATDPRFVDNPYVMVPGGIRFYAGQPLVAPGGYRVGTLCIADSRPRTFTAEQAALLSDLAQWVQKELVIDTELERAAQMQAGLLPHVAPDLPGYQVAGACLPSRTVGGDFYDWSVAPDGLVLSLVDVMGKGAGAAIMAAAVRAVLRGSVQGGGVARSLLYAGAILHSDLSGAGLFATAFHAALDTGTGVLTYADAGHGLTVVVRADGTAERLPALGLPLGVLDEPERAQGSVKLEIGDLLVSFSDGLLDLVGGTSDLAFAAVQSVVAGAATAQDAVDAVLRLSLGAADRPDDLTVLVVRRAA